jgi:hypothetical protein
MLLLEYIDLPLYKAMDPTFSPNQIVCIEAMQSLLFGEMVQHVTARRHCWVRPLVLATAIDRAARIETIGDACWEWYDLRQGADLLLPQQVFRAALDVEVLPLMSLLYQAEDKPQPECDRGTIARQQLNLFVRQVCDTKPELFR